MTKNAQAILRICRECLEPDGIAAVSYNTLPGWNWSGSLREFIRQAVRSITEPQQQITAARNAIEFLAENAPSNSIHAAYYKRARDRLRGESDAYLYHDYVTDQNRPFYFHEFAAMADANELKFFGEADFRHSSGFGLEMAGRTAVAQTPREHREQLLDFLLNTSYRSSMLCHVDCALTPPVQHQMISELHLALFDPMRGVEFDVSNPQPLNLPMFGGTVTITDPVVKASLRQMIARWPQTVTAAELYSAVTKSTAAIADKQTAVDSPEALARTMLAFYGAGLIRAFKTPPRLVDDVSDRPQVTPVVRAAAARGLQIVNQWHQNVRSLSADQRLIVSLLEGTRDITSLASEYQQLSQTRSHQTSLTESFVSDCLRGFASQRLLVA